MESEKVLVLDFGSEYNQLLTRKIRELNVYSEVYNHRLSVEEIKEMAPKGIILSGGKKSIHDGEGFSYDEALFDLDIPILGIGYGMSYMSSYYGGDVAEAGEEKANYQSIRVKEDAALMEDIPEENSIHLYSGDNVLSVAPSFKVEATDEDGHVVAMSDAKAERYGVQFFPDDTQNGCGTKVLKNFLFNICKCSADWSIERFIDLQVKKIQAEVGDKNVLCGLSGGVDSSVVAVLLHKAIGDQLTCIFVDHGLLRKNEADEVMTLFEKDFHVNVIKVDAQEQFLSKLAGVSDPEKKRKIIGNEFINVFDAEAEKLSDIDFLAQGTLYSDVIESGMGSGEMIKSHHNVGGLPEHMKLSLIEPISYLFKDEVRELGTALGMPDHIVWRQPFPGPGLGIRVLGEVTEEKLHIVREADAVLREEIAHAGLDRKIWQYFAVLPDIRSVGVKDDARSYDYTVGIRAVHSVDGMTSEWAQIPFEVLDKISRRITSEVDHVNRVVYDISSKPPATIEWE